MTHTTSQKALILSIILSTTALISIASILLIRRGDLLPKTPVAHIYQAGTLIKSIPLNSVEEPYTFTVTSFDGKRNIIEVRQGSIGIVAADCPDKLCVQQGFIQNSVLPITCLPHRLVIQIRKENTLWE